MLDGAPWPLDADGHMIAGETVLLILVDYHGIAVEASIEKSSGNDVLDASAMKRMTTHPYHPMVKNGFPASSYARVPVNFGSAEGASEARLPLQSITECQTQPVPGVSPAELALAAHKQLTISPTPASEVPGTGQPRPTDANGSQINLDTYANVLVDPTRLVATVENLKPNTHAAFNANAANTISKVTFAPSDVQHWDVVSFHFRGSE